MKWARWFEAFRWVEQTKIGEDVRVSTIFLGLDHNYTMKGPPILWETMVFGGKHHHYQQRCSGSMEQAEAMHRDVVKMVKEDSTQTKHTK